MAKKVPGTKRQGPHQASTPRRRRSSAPAGDATIAAAGLSDALWQGMRIAANKTNDGKFITTAEADKMVVGLPLPSLAWDYALACNVYPMGRLAQITGEYGACKSALATDIVRWHLIYDGFGIIEETENKDIPDMRMALWEYNVDWIGDVDLPENERNARALTSYPNSLEEWMATMTGTAASISKMNGKPVTSTGGKGSLTAAKKKKAQEVAKVAARKGKEDATGKGKARTKVRAADKLLRWSNPYFVMIDSFNGSSTNAQLTAIDTDGAPKIGYAIEANVISRYAKAWPAMLRGTTISVIGTNHLKPKFDYHNNPIPNSPGGASIKFMESLELEMHRGPTGTYKIGDVEGIPLKMRVQKNCVGPTGREIRFALLWYWSIDDATGESRQYAAFDWHSATCNLYEDLRSNNKPLYNRLCQVVDIQFSSGTNAGKVWSNRLGISEDAPLDRATLGRMLDENIELREATYPILGIRKRTFFRPGRPLRETIDQASHAIDASIRGLYKDRDLAGFAEVTAEMVKDEASRRREKADEARARVASRAIGSREADS